MSRLRGAWEIAAEAGVSRRTPTDSERPLARHRGVRRPGSRTSEWRTARVVCSDVFNFFDEARYPGRVAAVDARSRLAVHGGSELSFLSLALNA